MAELVGERFESPDEVREFTDGKGRVDLVDLNGHAVGLGTFEPGWRGPLPLIENETHSCGWLLMATFRLDLPELDAHNGGG